VQRHHLAPVGEWEADPTAVAKRFMDAPYLWGGKTSDGIDCSGLVQVAFQACGMPIRRDSDMQAADLGGELGAPVKGLDSLQYGDILYVRKGHIAFMLDEKTCLNASGDFGRVL